MTVATAPRKQAHPSRREQVMLARRIRDGNARSREEMILRNQRLVHSIARQYTGRGLEADDLVQEGMVGLVRAADKFDPERGVAFSTYATWWIHQSIRRAIANTARSIRIPAHLASALGAVKRAEHDLGRRDPAAIARAAGVSRELCDALLQANLTPIPLHAPARVDGDTPLADFVADPASPDPETEAAREEVRSRVRRLMDLLPARERAIVRARFGFDGPPETLDAIAERYRLSSERVRQIQAKALARLRHAGRLLHLDALARDSELL